MSNETETALVKSTWAAVKAAFELQQVGDLFYATLFEMAPSLPSTIFKGVDQKEQSRALMTMIDGAVGLLGTDTVKLIKTLKDLGARHAGYGVEDAHYPVVAQALIATLKKGLGEKMTPEATTAWVNVYAVIESTMKEGAKTPEGKAARAKWEAKQAKSCCCNGNGPVIVGVIAVAAVAAWWFLKGSKQ